MDGLCERVGRGLNIKSKNQIKDVKKIRDSTTEPQQPSLHPYMLHPNSYPFHTNQIQSI